MAEAGYDNLTPVQQAEFDRLMTIKMGDWPAGLVKWVREQGPIRCGDQMADVVGQWVKYHT